MLKTVPFEWHIKYASMEYILNTDSLLLAVHCLKKFTSSGLNLGIALVDNS